MPELLLELFSEEIPARMQVRAAADLRRLVTAELEQAGLAFAAATADVTPRRLMLVVEGLAARQPDRREERRGPRQGAPDRAVEGFLRASGVSREQCELRETARGTFWFAVIERPGADTADLLPELLSRAAGQLPWPKSMRWGRHGGRWVRPLHAVLGLFDGRPLAGALRLGDMDLPFTDRTRGHRFLAPDAFAVTGHADYVAGLRARFVVAGREERRCLIRDGARALAAGAGLRLREDPGLLDELAGLAEWPVPLLAAIDPGFMDLPPELLVVSMASHQRYLALEQADGRLANRFVLISNMAADAGRDATIIAGNERVLRARLADARFFWNQDRQARLESRVPQLASVTFYRPLGTMAAKAGRIEALARWLAAFVPGCDGDLAARAARLAKADLVTGMVGEFPELQGVMGRYYALHDGEDTAVADAVAAHYAPRGPSDACPAAPVGIAVALADRLDTLVGFFAIGEAPTGSRDPFGLRRAALGLIRLILENRLRLPLRAAFEAARQGYDGLGPADGLLAFVADRLKVHLRGQGVRHDLISAVFALDEEDDLVRLMARVGALAAFLETGDGASLLTASRRAGNIVRIESGRDGADGSAGFDGAVAAGLLTAGAEQGLFGELEAAEAQIAPVLAREDFAAAMSVLAGLRRPIDSFFDMVTVNDSDPAVRANRLRLLGRIQAAMGRVADFSKVEIQGRDGS